MELARRAYHALVSEDLRRRLYFKVLHRRQYADIRSKVFHYERGQFSLRAFDRHHCIFIHVTKTAGTSVALSLFGEQPGHYTGAEYRVFFGRDFERYFKFAFVRNPWDRALSAFKYLKSGGWNSYDRAWAASHLDRITSFEQFVHEWLDETTWRQHIHFRPQYDFVTDRRGRLLLDYLGYLETLPADFAHIATRLGITATLQHTNVTEKSDYRAAYTPATRDLVGRLYRRDVELFGYDFDGIRQRRVIGPE